MSVDLAKRFAYFSVQQRWPNHINIDVCRQTLCLASDGDLFLRCNELQERFNHLNEAIHEAQAQKQALTRKCADLQASLGFLDEEIRLLENLNQDHQHKLGEASINATQYSCEYSLLQNQPPPRLPPVEDVNDTTDLQRLSEDIFDMYAALLVLRAGEIVLFEDMKNQLENRPSNTRTLKQTIRDIRKKIRDYEHSIMNLTNEQKKWKSTLKAGKMNICRRARQQHNGLKEEAAKLKRTIDLFNDEKEKLAKVAQDFELSLNTNLGEQELALLMEHFEPVLEALQKNTYGDSGLPSKLVSAFRSAKNLGNTATASNSGGPSKPNVRVMLSSVEDADRINKMEKLWLDSVANKVKMEGNIMRAEFDIQLLEASLTAESYYDKKLLECEKKRIVRKYVHEKPSDELLGFKDSDLAEYFDPDVKFPGRNRCMELTGTSS